MAPRSEASLFKPTWLFALVVIALLALRQDFWLSDNAHLIAGLPVGLAFHVGYCLLVSLALALFVRKGKS